MTLAVASDITGRGGGDAGRANGVRVDHALTYVDVAMADRVGNADVNVVVASVVAAVFVLMHHRLMHVHVLVLVLIQEHQRDRCDPQCGGQHL